MKLTNKQIELLTSALNHINTDWFNSEEMYEIEQIKALLKKENRVDMVTIVGYYKTEVLSREEAINKYLEGMMACEGSEQESYADVYCKLMTGKSYIRVR